MSKKEILIVTTKRSRFGQKLVFPVVGEMEVSAEGTISLPKEVADSIVEKGLQWEYASAKDAPKEEIKNVEVPEEEPIVIVEKEEPKEEISLEVGTEETDGGLDLFELTVKGLKEVCKDAGLPLDEYKSLKKPQLIEYIQSKL